MNRRDFLKLGAAVLFGVAVSSLTGFTYAIEIEPEWLDKTIVELVLPNLDPAFDRFRLVQVSDIHASKWMPEGRLASVVDAVNSLRPDLVAITGDFVSHSPWKFQQILINQLRRLDPVYGSVAVLGNHDHWNDADIVRSVIAESGLTDLDNSFCTLRRQGTSLHFAGVDDYMEHKDRLDEVLKQLPREGAAVLLAHEPDYANISAPTGRFDLQISGHTHGGQVSLPLIGAPILPSYGRQYPRGLYRIKQMQLYTNRGVGMIHLPFRFNSRPEVTLFVLRSPEAIG